MASEPRSSAIIAIAALHAAHLTVFDLREIPLGDLGEAAV
jgi:hypothetical protein